MKCQRFVYLNASEAMPNNLLKIYFGLSFRTEGQIYLWVHNFINTFKQQIGTQHTNTNSILNKRGSCNPTPKHMQRESGQINWRSRVEPSTPRGTDWWDSQQTGLEALAALQETGMTWGTKELGAMQPSPHPWKHGVNTQEKLNQRGWALCSAVANKGIKTTYSNMKLPGTLLSNFQKAGHQASYH